MVSAFVSRNLSECPRNRIATCWKALRTPFRLCANTLGLWLRLQHGQAPHPCVRVWNLPIMKPCRSVGGCVCVWPLYDQTVMYNSEDSGRQWEIDSKIRTTRSLLLYQWEVEVCVWEREVRHSGWLTVTLRLRQSDMIVFLFSLPLAVCLCKMHKKKLWQSMKNVRVRDYDVVKGVNMHCSLSAVLVTSSHTHLIHSFAGQRGRSCALLCVCGFKADASVCCLPCQSQPPLLRLPSSHPSIRPSVYPSVNQSSVPLSIIFSVLCETACWCRVSFFIVQL